MVFYNVVRPCVVGKLHYATVPVQPIEVDDDVAAPLVKSGCLAPYGCVGAIREDIACVTEAINTITLSPPVPREEEDPEPEKPAPRPRNPRRPKA